MTDLIAWIQKRDADTLIKWFYQHHYREMINSLMHLGLSRVLAEDLLQDALTKAYEQLLKPDAPPIDSFKNYVWVIAKRKWSNYLRDNAQKKEEPLDEAISKDLQNEPYYSLHEETHCTDTLTLLETLVATDCEAWLNSFVPPLTDLRKRVILDVLRAYREDKNRKDIAQQYNMRENTFNKLFRDASQAIRKIILKST